MTQGLQNVNIVERNENKHKDNVNKTINFTSKHAEKAHKIQAGNK